MKRYTEVYVRQRIAAGFGPNYIIAELKHRGITHSLVRQYLPHDAMLWWEALFSILQKKYQEQDLNLTKKSSARLVRFLMQRGFDSERIYRWIQQCQIT
ncbi:regulatory protein RecX [Coxiella-like endosymbiont]|uniref:regulatory protein RecX n=1 Tax=Coxiella-like endosymbiont TaxID=1592897 RepID=UPI00272BD711|nr:regulatory protein RecX [Coxiella-like endosymbiont]